MKKTEMIMTAVQALGYAAEADADGDVMVRYQMKNIYILAGEEEEPYVSVLYPQFHELSEGEETLVLATCNKMTREVKQAKVYIDQTLANVSASCEFFYADEESLRFGIGHALGILGMIRSTFYRIKSELSE